MAIQNLRVSVDHCQQEHLPQVRRGGSCRRSHHRQKKLLPQAASQARKLLPHRRQEGFAAPQARKLLPHHRQEGFLCRTTGKRAFAALMLDGFVAAKGKNK